MPLFGAHLSIAGGLHKAVSEAVKLGMDTVQIFTGSPRSWPVAVSSQDQASSPKSKPSAAAPAPALGLADQQIQAFRQAFDHSRLRLPLAHDGYLINLAAPEPELARRSLEAFVLEMRRAEALRLRYLVMHPGSATDGDEKAGLARVAAALDAAHRRCPGFAVQVLLETTAGQGTNLGYRFEHLATILSLVAEPQRLGVCLDTCHVFAAGYPLAPAREYRATMKQFDRLIGLPRLRAFHVNDSRAPLGSRVDRHAHLGKGQLGLAPFQLLVADQRFADQPMILETPKEDAQGQEMDAVNLAILRGLVKSSAHGRNRG